MGVKQSKRSLDITEAATKGEIEGFGNEGKVEKIIDGVVEKVAANGHVDGDLQNGGESHQNGMEPVQNGEAATVAAEVTGEKAEKIDVDEAAAEGAVNGLVENGEMNGEAEKTGEEAKKSEEKKEKKKEKKDKVLKKRFSFKNFSFSKKDKSKPKEEKSPEKMDEAGIEETPSSPEQEGVASPTSNDMTIPEIPKVEEVAAQPEVVSSAVEMPAEVKMEQPTPEKISEVVSSTTAAIVEDLPPPLPASPPPSEPVKEMQEAAVKTETDLVAAASTSSTNVMDTAAGILKDAEQMAIETGKQIEEKATNLLKTVEEKAEESLKTAGEVITQKSQELAEGLEKALTIEEEEGAEEKIESEPETKSEETIPPIPVDVESVTEKAEETTDKIEESGGGESLAEVSGDLVENVAEGTIDGVNPDSLDISEPLPPPPPPVEAATGE